MNELNPNHGVTQELHDQWYKLCAILLFKSGQIEATITSDDIERFTTSGLANIVAHPSGHTLTLRLVSDEEAAKLARGAGGLPV